MKAVEKTPKKKNTNSNSQSFNSMKELSDSKYKELNAKLRKALSTKPASL